jgi:hypothetical protein
MKPAKIFVTKASGTEDVYSEEKLRHSLSRSGVGEKLINEIISEVSPRLFNGIPTREIYRLAFDILRKRSSSHAGRYNLKRAIMALGPSGFPFENYIAAIFKWQGYTIQMKKILEGVCVSHEIDVLAENERHVLLIECKYHNSPGIFSDVKVPLYIQSRYRDVLGNWNKNSPKKPLEGWVVTNTKFSSDALRYGICAGLKLLGWNFPVKKSLSNLVDESGLYPITCLNTLTNKEKELILNSGIVLCKELIKQPALLENLAITPVRRSKIITEMEELCKAGS